MATMFDKKAENIVNAVMMSGKDSVSQVALILQDVHGNAIEQVAEMFAKNSARALQTDPPDYQKSNFCASMSREVRAMKKVQSL